MWKGSFGFANGGGTWSRIVWKSGAMSFFSSPSLYIM